MINDMEEWKEEVKAKKKEFGMLLNFITHKSYIIRKASIKWKVLGMNDGDNRPL